MKARAVIVVGGGWLTPGPDSFAPGKEKRYQLCRSKTRPSDQFGHCGKSLFPMALQMLIVQPVASR